MQRVFSSNQQLDALFSPLALPESPSPTEASRESSEAILTQILKGEQHDDHEGEPGNEDIHRLIHQAYNNIGSGYFSYAKKLLIQAEQLATERGARLWLAQIAYTRGFLLDHSAKPAAAIPFFERALRGFEEEDIPRMALGAALFLGNVLSSAGQTTRALEVLHRALNHDVPAGDAGSFAYAHLRFGLYEALGATYHTLGDPTEALNAFKSALSVEPIAMTEDDLHRVDVRIIRAMLSLDRPDSAIEMATRMLETDISRLPKDWQLVAELHYWLSVAYLMEDRPHKSIEAGEESLVYMRRLLGLTAHGTQTSPYIVGELYMNLAQAWMKLNHPERTIAYLRRAREILAQYAPEEAETPRELLAKLQTTLPDYRRYLVASDPTYQKLKSLDSDE